MGFQLFDKDLKEGLKPVYLFYGSEDYLMEQYIHNMIEAYVPKGHEDFNLQIFDGDQTPLGSVLDACETLPFFSTHKVVVVKNSPYFKSKKSELTDALTERLLKYLESPSMETYLFFVSSGSIDKRKKVTKSVEKHGRLIEFGKLNPQIFMKWVHKKIKLLNKDIEQKALSYLISRLSYLEKDHSKTLLEVDNEIKVLCSSVYEKEFIQKEDIDRYIKKPLEADIFKLVDAVGRKKADEGILMMHHLLESGEAIQGIFHMICRQFRLLKKIQMLVHEGLPQPQIAKALGLHPYVVKLIVNQIDLFTSAQLTEILQVCSDIDYKMKSTNIQPVLAVEALMVTCSQMVK